MSADCDAPRTGGADAVVTLIEAAERLGVHYMTAYRYVRTGRLEAHQDGAEWRVRTVDLDRLITARGSPGELAELGETGRPNASNTRRPVDWAGRVEERLLSGDEGGAWTVVENAMAAGMAPDTVYLDVLGPAMHDIGERWAAGDATVADEHQASAIVLRLIGRLGPRFARRGRKRGAIIVAAPAGDTHGLPVALLADLLRGRGFRVIDLGADVPCDSLAATVRGADGLVVVGLCATVSANDRGISDAIAAIRAASTVPVVLGGRAIATPQAAMAHGADGGGQTTPNELDLFEQLARTRA